MQPRRYTFVIADRQSGAVRRLTISLWPTLAAVVMILALPVLIGLGARWSASATIDDLQTTNAALQVENASYRAATGELADQISSLQTAVDQLGDRAAVDPSASRAMDKLPSNIKSRAMGGLPRRHVPPSRRSARPKRLLACSAIYSASSGRAWTRCVTASSDGRPWRPRPRRSGRLPDG